MRKPLVAALLALATAGAAAGPAMAAEDAGKPVVDVRAVTAGVGETAAGLGRALPKKKPPVPDAQAVSFAGSVSLSNCSGSLIRMPASQDSDPALVMSNGHCLESGFPGPGEVVVNQASSRSFGLLNANGSRVATLRASKLVYGTMTDTDVSLYQLTQTYAQIRATTGISPLTLSDTRPVAGSAISVVSGYWTRIYTCNIDGFVYRLQEGDWTWKDSVRYTSACNTIGGTSGSPVVDNATGKVVAVNNTGNESGERCTLNNPCEVDASGNVTVRQGINYAQQTYQIPACFTAGNKLALTATGCVLPKP